MFNNNGSKIHTCLLKNMSLHVNLQSYNPTYSSHYTNLCDKAFQSTSTSITDGVWPTDLTVRCTSLLRLGCFARSWASPSRSYIHSARQLVLNTFSQSFQKFGELAMCLWCFLNQAFPVCMGTTNLHSARTLYKLTYCLVVSEWN